jgi:hemophore-related protein
MPGSNDDKETTMTTRRTAIPVGAGLMLAGLLYAPTAAAAPCSAAEATGTIGSVSAQASQFLDAHPGSDRALSEAYTQNPEDARVSVRAYFTAHPDEYLALKGITAPLVDLQNRCGTAGVPADVVAAFNEFQAG